MSKFINQEQFLDRLKTGDARENCPTRKALELLNGKWRTHVLLELCRCSPLRFGELKKAIPSITNTMLTSTLRDLEEFGVIAREQFNEIPPRVEYSLTERGEELLPIFYEIAVWGHKYLST